jgi:hypothetical protein
LPLSTSVNRLEGHRYEIRHVGLVAKKQDIMVIAIAKLHVGMVFESSAIISIESSSRPRNSRKQTRLVR